MKVDDIILDLRRHERLVDMKMKELSDYYSNRKTFGYDAESLDKLRCLTRDVDDALRELKEFRDTDLTEKETGA